MEDDPLSPADRKLFDALEDVICEELQAQIAVKRLENEDGIRVTSTLIADVIWDAFELRERS